MQPQYRTVRHMDRETNLLINLKRERNRYPASLFEIDSWTFRAIETETSKPIYFDTIRVAAWYARIERSTRTSSACTRFDYRSRFADRLIASSVDEEAEKEGGSREPPHSVSASCRATTTCRLPPGFHEMDGSPAPEPRRMRLDTNDERGTVITVVPVVGEKLFTHFSTQTNIPDSRSDFLGRAVAGFRVAN